MTYIFAECPTCKQQFSTATSLEVIEVCEVKDCPFRETYCGLDERINTGKNDPMWKGACRAHDVLHITKKIGWLPTNARFAYDVASTAVIQTAKAIYTITAAPFYILTGVIGSALLWRKRK